MQDSGGDQAQRAQDFLTGCHAPGIGSLVAFQQGQHFGGRLLLTIVPGHRQGLALGVVGSGEGVMDLGVRCHFVLSRARKTGDAVDLNLPMPVQRIAANPNLEPDDGQLAIQRGPSVYDLEQCLHSASLASLALPRDAELKAERETGLFK